MVSTTIEARGRRLQLGGVTHVMGVINVSPESNNPHTIAETPEEALVLGRRYRRWGADLIDVGGQSSHYDQDTIGAGEEIGRVCPVVEALVDDGALVSVDTWKPKVAEAAVAAGAHIVNDTGGLTDPEMVRVVAATDAGVVAVHVDGHHPHDVGSVALMPHKAAYTADRFRQLLERLPGEVIDRLVLDPGVAVNYRGDYAAYTRLQMQVIRESAVIADLGRPLLLPIPRKRDIHWVSAYITLALEAGADMIRVHDVAIASELVRLWERQVPR